MSGLVSLLAVTLVAGATLAIGVFGLRVSRTTSDFFVASAMAGQRACRSHCLRAAASRGTESSVWSTHGSHS